MPTIEQSRELREAHEALIFLAPLVDAAEVVWLYDGDEEAVRRSLVLWDKREDDDVFDTKLTRTLELMRRLRKESEVRGE